jgi:hypothetical protein
LEVPAKLFLMGEYGVVEGGAAFLCALKPGFVYESAPDAEVHPESPLGRWSREFSGAAGDGAEPRRVAGVRPVSSGLGPGFGTSTAELISGAAFEIGALPETDSFWVGYRKRHPEASGADLAVQLEAMRGKGGFYKVARCDRITPAPVGNRLDQVLLFQADPRKKLKTHEDLARNRVKLDRERFDGLLVRFESLFLHQDSSTASTARLEALSVWDEFADFMAESGRETREAHAIRKGLRSVEGVCGVKGCGAGLHDSFVVAIRDAGAENGVRVAGERMGLKYLGRLQEMLA